MKTLEYLLIALVTICMLMPCSIIGASMDGDFENGAARQANVTSRDDITVKIIGQSSITENIRENLKATSVSGIDTILKMDGIDKGENNKDVFILDGIWLNSINQIEKENTKSDVLSTVKNGAPIIMVDGDSSFIESIIDELGTCTASLPEALLTAVKYYPEQKCTSVFHYVGSPHLTYENNLNTSMAITYNWIQERTSNIKPDSSSVDPSKAALAAGEPYWGVNNNNDHYVFQDFWPNGRGYIESKYYQLMNDPNPSEGVHWVVKYHIVGTPGCQLFSQGIRSDGKPYEAKMMLDWFVIENDLNKDTTWHPNDHMEWDMHTQKYEPQTTVGIVTRTYSMGIGIKQVQAGVSVTITTPDANVEWQGRESDQYARWWFNINEGSQYSKSEKYFDATLNAHCPGAQGDPWGGYYENSPQWEMNWAWPSYLWNLYYNNKFATWNFVARPIIY